LQFLAAALANFSVTSNYSWIKSAVDLKGSSQAIAKSKRRLQGQSPYMANMGLLYNSPALGTSVSLLYNRFGERIAQVGSLYDDDIIEMPRDVIDFTLAQSFWERYEIKISGKDLLGKEQEFVQAGRKVKGNQKGSTYAVGLAMKF
jgi:hypothetical protein